MNSTRIKVTIPPSMDTELRRHAEEAGISVSEFIRQAVTTKLRKADRKYTSEHVRVGRPNKKGETE